MLNQTAEYALRTAVLLAEHESAPVALRAVDLAEALQIPANYLSKILHQLAREGVLESQRGKSGGFRLARPAARIRLAEVVRPFDEIETRRTCLLGRPVCSDAVPCQAHARWKTIGTSLAEFFRHTTLAALVEPAPDATPAMPPVRSPSARTRGARATRAPQPTARGRQP
ncbi:MAG TPA: Rrf2 family transcriptional regulator [Gemmatimonadaceae bacterium]|nr:Rrf2 family transcriptional regulator [Gemmatimonadaceae bacterium]